MRPSKDEYYLRLAYTVAMRATCERKHVGAVLVDSHNPVVSTGYNGSPAGMVHCGGKNHLMVDGHCVRTLHAESNALDVAGVAARGSTLYVTVTPCFDCAKRIVNAGIARVVYNEHYDSRYGLSGSVGEYLGTAGVRVQLYVTESLIKWREFCLAMNKMTVNDEGE